jgi:hypothetical protein
VTDAIERLARDISSAPGFTFEHLAAARAAAGLDAVPLPSGGRRPRSRARQAVLYQAALTQM